MSLENYIKWFEAHERAVLVVLGGCVLWFALGKIDTVIANHDKANLQQAQVAAAVLTAKNQQTEAVVAQQAADLVELKAQMAAQVAAVEAEKVALINALANQKKIDVTLTPTELTNRWNVLVPTASASVTNGQVTLPPTGAVATVQQLEEVPVLTNELSGTQDELATANKMVQQEGDQVATLNTLVAGKDALLAKNETVCQEQIKVVKDAAAKSKRKWFIGGLIAGLSLRGAAKIIFGI